MNSITVTSIDNIIQTMQQAKQFFQEHESLKAEHVKLLEEIKVLRKEKFDTEASKDDAPMENEAVCEATSTSAASASVVSETAHDDEISDAESCTQVDDDIMNIMGTSEDEEETEEVSQPAVVTQSVEVDMADSPSTKALSKVVVRKRRQSRKFKSPKTWRRMTKSNNRLKSFLSKIAQQ